MTSIAPSRSSRFRQLMAPHLDSAYSLARYLCQDHAAAEDIAQEALLKAYAALDGFQGDSPRAWLLTIVRNAYIDWVRRTRGWRVMTSDRALEDLIDVADESATGAEAELIERGDAEALRQAIEALAEPFREVVVLRDLQGLSYREVARITGVPSGTVMSRLARGRGLLQRRLRPTDGGAQ